MKPLSLRSRAFLASLLWTGGLLALMHMLSMLVMHAVPIVRQSPLLVTVAIGVGLMSAGFAVARRGLTPFSRLREQLVAVRSGASPRVAGQYPGEVQPLVDDVNALLAEREKTVERALATAGDLAHTLKTPLALLLQEATRAAQTGHPELASAIELQVTSMARQVDYHLARARAASAAKASGRRSLQPDVEALLRTMRALHAARPLRLSADLPPDCHLRVARDDLDEMLGNLLDNACKWARSEVRVSAARDGNLVRILVDDDGPGLPPELRQTVLQRGVRADEAAPGHGLGLAIACDLAEVYGGSVTLSASPLGGLRAGLTLPSS
ncbi:MAG: sensor histidine kinase [Bryobacteraceae bacterium]|nr:sensor histidine kinase [Bryobacteraceae bacterium]